MKLHDYNSLTKKQHDSFFKFLESTQDSDDLAKVNMYDIDWENKPNTLPYILTYSDRFNSGSGEFNILFDGDVAIAASGVYLSNFSKHISIAGVRTYVDKKYRHNTRIIIREYLLARHKAWSIENDCKIVMLSFNEYNKHIINILKRSGLGDTVSINRNDNHLFSGKIHEVEFPCNIQNTKQYIFYEKLDESFSFDWSVLKY